MSEVNLEEVPEKELTPAEMKEMRANLLKYYKEQIDVLKLQSEFEKLNADIAESQARAYMNRIRIAQMAMGPPKENPADPDGKNEGTKIRKLKED